MEAREAAVVGVEEDEAGVLVPVLSSPRGDTHTR